MPPPHLMSRKRARSEAEEEAPAAPGPAAPEAWRDPRTGEPRFDFMHPAWQAARRRTRRQAKTVSKDLRPLLAQIDAERAAKRRKEATEVLDGLVRKVHAAKARGLRVSASQRRRLRRRVQALRRDTPPH